MYLSKRLDKYTIIMYSRNRTSNAQLCYYILLLLLKYRDLNMVNEIASRIHSNAKTMFKAKNNHYLSSLFDHPIDREAKKNIIRPG